MACRGLIGFEYLLDEIPRPVKQAPKPEGSADVPKTSIVASAISALLRNRSRPQTVAFSNSEPSDVEGQSLSDEGLQGLPITKLAFSGTPLEYLSESLPHDITAIITTSNGSKGKKVKAVYEQYYSREELWWHEWMWWAR